MRIWPGWNSRKGLGADSEEKHEPVSDIDTVVVDSLKALDPKRPIREGDIARWLDLANEIGVDWLATGDHCASNL